MEILVVGNRLNEQECKLKFGDKHHYHLAEGYDEVERALKPGALAFDFLADPHRISVYKSFPGNVFVDVSKNSLQQLVGGLGTSPTFFGFVGLPDFLSREILEVAMTGETDRSQLQMTCLSLNTKFAVVKDQVGLVTARIICMIINEAYFAIEENIASRNDIDLAMKLGTNYPYGPFEWCEKIGVKNVYELLKAVYEATEDARYGICELLER
ncbi:MAG TPA: 3-hydroxyacyl-CoA dehydrogenase family protein, partial [Cyclobacteriaceae bacterium]|nr:3-hydroxyacyl-CoA dehydrogenase family protein [Cyclobacteriaceae bacterium]